MLSTPLTSLARLSLAKLVSVILNDALFVRADLAPKVAHSLPSKALPSAAQAFRSGYAERNWPTSFHWNTKVGRLTIPRTGHTPRPTPPAPHDGKWPTSHAPHPPTQNPQTPHPKTQTPMPLAVKVGGWVNESISLTHRFAAMRHYFEGARGKRPANWTHLVERAEHGVWPCRQAQPRAQRPPKPAAHLGHPFDAR